MTNKRELSLRRLASKSSKHCNRNLEPSRERDQFIDYTPETTVTLNAIMNPLIIGVADQMILKRTSPLLHQDGVCVSHG